MAAYAALVSLEHVLEQILGRDDQDYCNSHDKQQIKSLYENIVFLVAFLEYYPQDAGELLEGRMRDAANRAQYIIESRILDEMHGEDYCGCWGVVDCIRQVILGAFPTHGIIGGGAGLKLHNWRKLHEELQNVMKEMEAVVEEAMRIKTSIGTRDPILSQFPTSSACGSLSSSRLAQPSGEGTGVVGLGEDILVMIEKLALSPPTFKIITIYGTQGIGKTTLARCVYDNAFIKDHFDFTAFVTVAPHYRLENILLDVIYSLSQSVNTWSDYRMMNGWELTRCLRECLVGIRYLIVIDNICDRAIGHDLELAFPFNSRSRILITTRNWYVASYFGQWDPLHCMKLLDDNLSWDLLRGKVFGGEHCPPQLEQLGKFIASRCGGLPLLIVVIAEILFKANQVQETWKRIADDVNEVAIMSAEGFEQVLWFNYKYLPHHLKSFLLYMVGFPPNYEISISKLVKLWDVDEFSKSKSNRFKSLDDVAQEYLEDLVEKSLIIVSKKRFDGKIKAFKIHDFIRDIALRKSKGSKCLQVMSKFSTSLQDDILNLRRRGVFELPSHHFAFAPEFESFPEEICELFHLRYLVLTFICEGKFMLPQSLLKLQNLQTLIIMPSGTKSGCTNALYLFPFEIWRLPKLRHLMLFDVYLSVPCLRVVTTLEYLRTLSRISSFTCSKRMLKLMPNLNKLEIVYPLDVISKTGWCKCELNNLIHFYILEKLNIHVERGPGPFHMVFPNYSNLLMQKHDIAFLTTLKKLTLSGCLLPWQDMTIVGSLPNLEVLKLRNWACYGDDWETKEGEFCRLKMLIIDGSDPRRWIIESSSHFPCLQCLHLNDCCVLNEIPHCIGNIPTLETLELYNCNPFVVKSVGSIEFFEREWIIFDDWFKSGILRLERYLRDYFIE